MLLLRGCCGGICHPAGGGSHGWLVALTQVKRRSARRRYRWSNSFYMIWNKHGRLHRSSSLRRGPSITATPRRHPPRYLAVGLRFGSGRVAFALAEQGSPPKCTRPREHSGAEVYGRGGRRRGQNRPGGISRRWRGEAFGCRSEFSELAGVRRGRAAAPEPGSRTPVVFSPSHGGKNKPRSNIQAG